MSQTNEQIVHGMNELINALEIRILQLQNQASEELVANVRHNDLKRSLGQLKAARTSFYSSTYESVKEIK